MPMVLFNINIHEKKVLFVFLKPLVLKSTFIIQITIKKRHDPYKKYLLRKIFGCKTTKITFLDKPKFVGTLLRKIRETFEKRLIFKK